MNLARSAMVLGIVVVVACFAAAQTASDDRGKATTIDGLLQQHRMTLAKAIGIAERRSKGHALRAVSEIDEQGKLTVHIHCFANGAIFHVQIDGETGKTSIAAVNKLDEYAAPNPTTAPSSAPSGPPPVAKPASPPAITLAELKFKGKDYLDSRVQIVNCKFVTALSEDTGYLLLADQDNLNYDGIFVDKDRFADALVQLRSGMILNFEGAVKLHHNRKR